MARANGLDLSKYDISFDPTRSVEPIDFVIQRASYRLTKDEKFDEIYPGVAQVPIRLAYHYLNSDKPWKDQADFFLNVVQGKNFHAYVCDFEDAYNVLSQRFAYDCWQFLTYIVRTTGKRAILYTGRYTYMDWLVPSQRTYGIDWNNVDYWQAQYFIPPTNTIQPVMPTGRTAGWKLWQWTSSADGSKWGTGRIGEGDLNVFNGTVAEMRSWLGLADEPTPPPPPAQEPTLSLTFTDAQGVTYEAKDVVLKRI